MMALGSPTFCNFTCRKIFPTSSCCFCGLTLRLSKRKARPHQSETRCAGISWASTWTLIPSIMWRWIRNSATGCSPLRNPNTKGTLPQPFLISLDSIYQSSYSWPASRNSCNIRCSCSTLRKSKVLSVVVQFTIVSNLAALLPCNEPLDELGAENLVRDFFKQKFDLAENEELVSCKRMLL